MATATVSFSQFAPGVKQVHTGIMCNGAAMTIAASGGQATTFCASSIGKMLPLPHGATIVDFWAKCAFGGANTNVKFGTSNTDSGIMAPYTMSMTFSLSASVSLDLLVLTPVPFGDNDRGTIRAPGGTRGGAQDLMPVRISLSDDANPRFVWLQTKLSAAQSDSAFMTVMFFYTMDGMLGHTTIR